MKKILYQIVNKTDPSLFQLHKGTSLLQTPKGPSPPPATPGATSLSPEHPGRGSPQSTSITISHDSIISIASSEEGAIVGSGDEYIWNEEDFSTPAGPPREGRTQQEVPAEEEAQPVQGASGGLQPNFQGSPPESILNIEDLNENPKLSPIQRWGWNTPSRITRAGLSGEEPMRPIHLQGRPGVRKLFTSGCLFFFMQRGIFCVTS